MTEFLKNIDWTVFTNLDLILKVARSAALLFGGIPLLFVVSKLVARLGKKHLSEQWSMIIQKGLFYGGVLLILVMVMNELGFKLTALIGTAGVVGIALGFASQTSVSNIISGIFLIWEKPFTVGDLIRIGDRMGFIVSIDLLSVKIRTFDNLFVRIPNETLIKTEVVNITRYPIRRMDIDVSVAYKEDVAKVITALKEVANKNPFCLDEPEPLILFKNFGGSGLEFLVGLWFVKTDYSKLKNSIMQEIKIKFDEEDIEIPFPHRTLYTGKATDPFPVRVVDPKEVFPEDQKDSGKSK
jgi:small-conductance mechanosensitive channel